MGFALHLVDLGVAERLVDADAAMLDIAPFDRAHPLLRADDHQNIVAGRRQVATADPGAQRRNVGDHDGARAGDRHRRPGKHHIFTRMPASA
jgi:hypothetical protein